MAAIFIVLFLDTRTEPRTPRHQLSWWGYYKSWIKDTAMCHSLLTLLGWVWTLTCAACMRIWSWVPPILSPRRPPDRQARRRRRFQETLLYHTRPNKPRSSRAARMLAAAMALAHLTSADADAIP